MNDDLNGTAEFYSEVRDWHRETIEGIERLPSVPIVLAKIIECIEDPISSASDLTDIILKDPAIVAKILNLSNSALYGQARKVEDVTTAVVVVGFQGVYQTAAGASLVQSFNKGLTSKELDIFDFWMYSVSCAANARKLAELCGYPKKEQAYLVGLLHDIGKLVILQLFKSVYEDVLFEARAEGVPLSEKERATFEFDHTEAGQWLAEKWKLPETLQYAIGTHHRLDDIPEEHAKAIFLCHVAEYITRAAGVGWNGDSIPPRLHERATSVLDLHQEDIAEQIQTISELTTEIESVANSLFHDE